MLNKAVEELLNRSPTEEDKSFWADLLTKYKENEEKIESVSIIIFRLDQDWFALPTLYFKEILLYRSIHRVPHRMHKVLLGLVNMGGELQLCVDLKRLFEMRKPNELIKLKDLSLYHRLIVIMRNEDLWVCPVDELEGTEMIPICAIKEVPTNMSKSTRNFLKGIISKGEREIGLLDEELLFSSLRRSVI